MNPAMAFPCASSPTAPGSSAAFAAAAGKNLRQSSHRPRVKRLETVAQPSSAAAPAAARPKKMSRSERQEAAKITRPCTECGRRFWSWKALFGHMRCHPNRPWRGIEPPAQDGERRLPGSSSTRPDLAADPPTDERARAIGETTSDAEAEAEAATCLILLKGEMSAALRGVDGDELRVSPSLASARSTFTPSSCDTSSHRPGERRTGHSSKQTAGRDSRARKRKAAGEGNLRAVQLHRCDICSMNFSSGQALGGHMSSHWKEECRQQAAGAEAASSRASRTGGGGGGFRFDLNLPPVEETEDNFSSACGAMPDLRYVPAAGDFERRPTSFSQP